MAERSMIMYGLRFNVRQKPEKVVYPRDINGENLLEVFDDWCNENMNAALHRASSDDWIWIKRIGVDQNKNVACVDIQTGKAGEAGELVDTSESNPSIPFSEYHAPTVDARVVLYVPPKCDVAYACVEHVVHGGSDIFFLDSFKRGFDGRFPKITLNRVRVIETMDLWKQFEGMSEIELRFMSPSKDIADGPCMKDGFLSYRLQHRRSKRFSLGLFESIRNDPREALELILPNSMNKENLEELNPDIYVTLTDNNGDERKFAIEGLPSAPFRQILPSGSDRQGKMTDAEYTNYCVKACKDVMENEGYIVR
ncbi:MAG: hypothetical protein DBY20_05705 [Coriobacteriia bacterium]|nr:MAG: hypothetical protein DBY20_05705 [Coriobacteriia bacterium]